MESFDKLLTLLRVLRILSRSEEVKLLNADGVPIVVQTQDNDRIAGLYSFMRSNFQRDISLEEIASQAAMTIPSFCRYFKKVTGKTFTQLLNEFRIVHACKLLTEGNMTISEIAFECGFNNFTNFNKQFKRVTGQTPSQYRKDKWLYIT
jgi:AraC-like DNA-binding protein